MRELGCYGHLISPTSTVGTLILDAKRDIYLIIGNRLLAQMADCGTQRPVAQLPRASCALQANIPVEADRR